MSESERRPRARPKDPNAPGNYDPRDPAGDERVGLVLSGAAARGPYQAGAIAELLPTLVARQLRPVVLMGTSSGALNAALLAQFAAHGEDAGERAVETWLSVRSVFDDPVLSLPWKTLRLSARALGVPAIGTVKSLLDPRPLKDLAYRTFDGDQLSANIRDGLVQSVGAAATFCPPGRAAARTRLFVQGDSPENLSQNHAVDVVPTEIRVDHLLASAAIPVLFPPVEIKEPAAFRGHYIDGGVRLNAPLDAAISLGVTRLVVVSGHSVVYGHQPPAASGGGPDLATSVAIILRSALNDGLSDDLLALGRRNERVQKLAAHLRREELPGRCVPYRVVAPRDGELAAMAAECFRARRWRRPDSYLAIRRLLAAAGDGIGPDELLSLILFDPEYARRQIELGRKHARAALDADWQIGPLTNP